MINYRESDGIVYSEKKGDSAEREKREKRDPKEKEIRRGENGAQEKRKKFVT